MKKVITKSARATAKLGNFLAGEILSSCEEKNIFKTLKLKDLICSNRMTQAQIICLEGDLGSGKTTFVQGFLKGLGVKGPYTSPTFIIMKHYKRKAFGIKFKISNAKSKMPKVKHLIQNIYHIDAYRIKSKDLLNLGWKEIITSPENIIIIEWADRVKKIIPKNALWINFKWIDNNTRKIILKL